MSTPASAPSFITRLKTRITDTGAGLCVGLDPRPDSGMSIGATGRFLEQVAEESAPFAAAFKPNIAYFEAMGAVGMQLLEDLLPRLPKGPLVVLDAKRSDIPETQRYYAEAYFERWGVDAVTLNPLLGYDSLEPFLQYPGKGIYLLGITSNPGAEEFLLQAFNGQYLFERVQDYRERAAGVPGDIGLVAGLTNLEDAILERLADVPLLVPGLGAQGGDLSRLAGQHRKAPILVNVSRGILYRDADRSYAEKAKSYADRIRDVMP